MRKTPSPLYRLPRGFRSGRLGRTDRADPLCLWHVIPKILRETLVLCSTYFLHAADLDMLFNKREENGVNELNPA